MTATAKALGILLVEEIWDSIAEEVNSADLSDEQRRVLDERIATMDADPTAGSTWEEVKACLLSQSQS